MKKLLPLLLFALCYFQSLGQIQNGYPFTVNKSGHGSKTLVLIPGFACSGEVWRETLATYENNYSCHTLTMEGFAGSPPGSNPSFENWKTGIARYIELEIRDSCTILGHSMGGGLAMALAADFPEWIDSIIVVDALPCLQALQNPNFKSDPELDCSATVDQMTALPDEQFLQMQEMTALQMTLDPEKQDSIVVWSAASDRRTFAAMFCDFFNTDLREKIRKIKCPALILLESNFALFATRMEEQYAALETADLRYATRGLHFIMYDDKEWYFEQLDTFLNTH